MNENVINAPAKVEVSKGLLAAMDFNLAMDPAIKKALQTLGLPMDAVTEFPDLSTWRQAVIQVGLTVAATSTPYDAHLRLKDRNIPTDDQKASIRLRIYRPVAPKSPAPAFYWMHGGGMMGGTPEQDDVQMKQIACQTGAVVVSVDYRLAPEYAFPLPLNDCYTGLMWMVDHASELNIDVNKIAVGGASAGGGLAASLALMVRRKGGPQLLHQSLTYPMLDDRNETNSSHQITSLGVWDRAHNLYGWRAYLGTEIDGETVPEFAVPAREKDLSGLPPTWVAVGALDLFRDEAIEYALRLMEAGVSTDLHYYPGAVHGFDWHAPNTSMTHSMLNKRIQALKLAFGD